MRKHKTKLQIYLKSSPLHFSLFLDLLGGFNPDQERDLWKVVLEQRCIMLLYLCMVIMMALKFKYDVCELSLEGMHMILQQIQHSSDWADGGFFEPNNQGLCSSKNG